MRRNVSDGMDALIAADRPELMSAMNLLFTEGSKYWGVREMVIAQCFARYPEEPVFDPEKSFFQSMLASGDERRWAALSIAKAVGAEWFKRDGVKALERLGTTKAEVGLDLLDWIVEREAFDLKTRKARASSLNLSRNCWLEARTVIERLVAIDPDATRRWVETVPERMAPSGETFDAVHYVHQAMRKLDAAAAADAWLQGARPSK